MKYYTSIAAENIYADKSNTKMTISYKNSLNQDVYILSIINPILNCFYKVAIPISNVVSTFTVYW